MSYNLNDPVVEAIVTARVSLLFNQPFFGNLATRLKPVDATKWCKTAATDGRHLYYNREFIKSLTKEELIFLIGHEVMHCVYDHLGRTGKRDHELFNMANDYIVNYTLVKERVGTMPKSGLYDERYTDEMTSEEVYALLQQRSTQVRVTLDEHLDMRAQQDEEGNSNEVTVTVMGDGDGPPRLSEEDLQRIRNEVKAAVINAAQAVGAGKVPAGVRRLIDAFTHPIMDWRALLEMHIQSQIRDDYTFSRPNRRSAAMDVILPGQNLGNKVEVACAIDTSGSMTDEMLRDFLTEVKGIMDTFSDFVLDLWTFDTQVYNHQRFTPENIDSIMQYQPQGGGGTMFECNWEFMKAHDIEPKRFVMFTDGYPNSTWGDSDYCDTLFVIHGNTNIEPPFGLWAYYEKKAAKK